MSLSREEAVKLPWTVTVRHFGEEITFPVGRSVFLTAESHVLGTWVSRRAQERWPELEGIRVTPEFLAHTRSPARPENGEPYELVLWDAESYTFTAIPSPKEEVA